MVMTLIRKEQSKYICVDFRFIKFKFGDDKIFKSAEFEIIVLNEMKNNFNQNKIFTAKIQTQELK